MCEKAGCSLVIPSYSMAVHYASAHGGADKMSLQLRAAVVFAPHEEFHVKQLLDVSLGRVRKAPCADASCAFAACKKQKK